MSEQSPVQYELEGEIGVIRINNPPVNALSHAVRSGVMDALQKSSSDDSRAVLLLCAGRTFIAGADITEFGKPPKSPSLPELVTALENHGKPIVSVLHGTALGGGLEVAMATHYRIALPGSRMGLPEVNLGILPGAGGTQRLPRLVGVEPALDMITGGKPINADRALQLGLIDKIAEAGEDGDAAGIEYARQLASAGEGPRPTGARKAEAPQDAAFFDNYREKLAPKTKGLIAPGYIVELVEASTRLPLTEGEKLERERFQVCLESPQSAALRHVFFAQRAAAKIPGIPKDTPERKIESAGVIGAGTMGGGIAMNFIQAGIPVTLVETSDEALQRGMETIRRNYATSVKRGRFTEDQIEGFLSRINGTTAYSDLADADVVIEAVFENMAVKKEVFGKLHEHTKTECILATNTSYLDVNEIAASIPEPERVIGAHFFSPANVMKLLEVVRGDQTADDIVVTFMKLGKTIGKIPVLVGVCHGFVGNRMLKGYLRQAQLLLLSGASPEQVDGTIQDWGMAMGPCAVVDLAGLDVGYRSRQDQGIEPGSRPEFAVMDKLVEMNRLGQKTGAGFYRYDPETRKRQPDPEVRQIIAETAEEWEVTPHEPAESEVVDRLILALVNEGAAILEEGIATRPSDIDTVWINGYGFPSWRGGPMFYADHLGLDEVVSRLEALREQTGDDFWQPAPLLVKLQKAGEPLGSLNK